MYAFSTFDPSFALYETSYSPTTWMCQSGCDVDWIAKKINNLRVFGQDIDYCLSQQKEGHCTLNFSLAMMVVIICCNAAKTVCMVLAVQCDNDAVLVTVGFVLHSY